MKDKKLNSFMDINVNNYSDRKRRLNPNTFIELSLTIIFVSIIVFSALVLFGR